MINVSSNNIITVARGDTFSFDVFVNVGTALNPDNYQLQPGDKLYFGLMEPNQPFECAVMRRVFTNADLNPDDSVKLTFTPEMTQELFPGKYYYSIKLEKENGEVSTIVRKTRFNIID